MNSIHAVSHEGDALARLGELHVDFVAGSYRLTTGAHSDNMAVAGATGVPASTLAGDVQCQVRDAALLLRRIGELPRLARSTAGPPGMELLDHVDALASMAAQVGQLIARHPHWTLHPWTPRAVDLQEALACLRLAGETTWLAARCTTTLGQIARGQRLSRRLSRGYLGSVLMTAHRGGLMLASTGIGAHWGSVPVVALSVLAAVAGGIARRYLVRPCRVPLPGRH